MDFYIKMQEEMLESQTVLYMRRTGSYGIENYTLMNRFKEWLKEHDLFCDDTVILAIPLDNPNITEPQKCRYDVCTMNLSHSYADTDEVKNRQLDGGRYVTFLLEHTAEAVQRAWEECFSELDKQGYLLDVTRPVTERYAKKLVDNHYCELCVPVL